MLWTDRAGVKGEGDHYGYGRESKANGESPAHHIPDADLDPR